MNAIPYTRVVRAARACIERRSEQPNAEQLDMHRDMLLTGIALDMASPRPSLSELGDHLGVAHSSCLLWERRWRDLPWRERYGWLTLVEGRMGAQR